MISSQPYLPQGTTDVVLDRLFPEADKYATDPVGWLDELGEDYWSAQRRIVESVAENRYTSVHSCHGIGKSWTAAKVVAWWLGTHKPGEAFAVTTAPTWRQVRSILWREIRRTHAKANLPGRITLDAQWYVGGSGRPGDSGEELVAMGSKPADTDQAAFQGIHARYVLVIVDEAAGVPRLLFDAIDSLATNVHARVLAIGNPDDPASHFADICKPGSGWNTIHISAFDSPAFTGEEVPDHLLELLVSPEWVEERKKRWGEESPTYQSKVLGLFPEVGEDTLIAPKFIRMAQQDVDLSGLALKDKGQYGVDVARYGSNKTVIYRNRAGMVRRVFEAAKTSTTETAGQVKARLAPHQGGVPGVIDADGIGGGVVDILVEQRVRGVVPFHGGAPAYDSTRFANRRAEVYWTFKEEMELGHVDLDPDDDQLASQLGSVKWELDSKGRVRIESKDKMAKRGLPSPDHADAAVLSFMAGARWQPDRDSVRAGRKREPDTLTGDLLDKEL